MKTFSEFSAAKRYQILFLGVAAVLTIVSANVAWLFPTRGELADQAYLLHKVVAIDVRNQLSAFLGNYEKSLNDGADVLSQFKTSKEDIVARLLKENQPFESLTLLDGSGSEVFKNHRFLLIAESDFKDRSEELLYKTAKEDRVYRGPIEISGISEPIVTIAVPVNVNSGFSTLIAEINLKFFSDVVRNVSVGKESNAYVVDGNGYVVAHPNSSLVFGRMNFLNRKIIAEAIAGREADTRTAGFDYKGESGENMFAVALPFELMNWAVVVEDPINVALGASTRISTVAIISFILEIFLVILLIWNYVNLINTASLFFQEKNQREAILNSLYDGVIEYDEKSMVVLMNPKAEEILGVKFAAVKDIAITPEIMKEKPDFRNLVELMYPALAAYASSVKELPGTSAKIMEVHLSNQDIKLLVTLSNVTDENGNTRGFLKVLHDISREQLVSRIKTEFVSIAAHQLRTPLSALKWTLKLLIDGDAGVVNSEQQNFLLRGYETNERMIKLVNDLLNAARIEEGKFGFEFKELNLETVVERNYHDALAFAKSKSVDLRFNKKIEHLPLIYADDEKVNLVITNLLENAIKYTPSGGSVIVELDRKEDFAVVNVVDTGVGIPASEQSRVFSKFFRASNVIRMETEGTGLGLFIIYNIAKKHGGDLHFNSTEGKGSLFTLTLPLKKELIPAQGAADLKGFLDTI